jgi:signal transduction histidine kinase/DNA-binding response OmpR family regulator
MGIEWSQVILLAAEFTFAVLFLRAFLAYLHRRDPLQRDIMLVFTPCMLLFCVDVVRRIHDRPLPTWVNVVALTALLAQPYLTVRLAKRLRAVPRWLDVGVLVVFVVTAGPLIFARRPLDAAALTLAVTGFLIGELVAAALIFGKARRRVGANRGRLMIAAGATVVFGVMVVLLGIGALPGTSPAYDTANRVLALASGLGYLVAFLPPRWLRRLFSASAAQSVTERLLRAPVESPEQVWQTYAEIMRVQTGADAVAVLMPRPDGQLARMAYAGPPLPTPDALTSDLTALIRQGQPARLREGYPGLVEHYGDDLGDDFVSVLSMAVPPDIEGAVLLFNRHRTLFNDDDLRLLAKLGGQAGILAERQAVLAAHRRMATELSASVEALTRASQAKSSFLANMSHELRTPLNAIIGFSDLMRHEEPDGDRRRVPAEWIEHIHTSGRHLLGLINDILDLAKVEAGRLDLRLAPLRVDTAIRELLTGLSPLLATKNLTVTDDMTEAVALADRVRFRQIVENLLSNAIKFTPEGGSVTVSVVGTDEHVFVTVADTGVGIAAADHARVFEEFQQVGDPDRQRAGTGLGLALTKRLVEAHDGEITLVSAPGEGSSFTVRLPAAPTIRPTPVESVDADEGAHAARVLLIEDDPQSAELMRTQLSSAGYRVDVAGSGETGLSAAGAHPPDAIVLDVTLPGMDGWEVIRRLKADERLAGIPVFFATIVDERPAGLALGACDYFVKPVDPAALLGALARQVAARPMPRVLVVDHDEAARQAIEDGLRAGGADVVGCADGRDGLALSREQAFDLIVCDLQSPRVDGFGLLAAIERDPAIRDTPVLGLSVAAGANRSSDDAAPLVAAAMAGGAGWAALVPGGHATVRREDT